MRFFRGVSSFRRRSRARGAERDEPSGHLRERHPRRRIVTQTRRGVLIVGVLGFTPLVVSVVSVENPRSRGEHRGEPPDAAHALRDGVRAVHSRERGAVRFVRDVEPAPLPSSSEAIASVHEEDASTFLLVDSFSSGVFASGGDFADASVI